MSMDYIYTLLRTRQFDEWNMLKPIVSFCLTCLTVFYRLILSLFSVILIVYEHFLQMLINTRICSCILLTYYMTVNANVRNN